VRVTSSRPSVHKGIYKQYKKQTGDPNEIAFYSSINEEIENSNSVYEYSPFERAKNECNYCKENMHHGSVCKDLFKNKQTTGKSDHHKFNSVYNVISKAGIA
jgi:hypothetical protein